MPRRFLFSFALAVAGLTSTEAWAGAYDLNLSRLGQIQNNTPVGDNTAFRSLSSELGVVMAPQPVDSADSLGLSAFAVSADLTINTINPGQLERRDAVLRSVRDGAEHPDHGAQGSMARPRDRRWARRTCSTAACGRWVDTSRRAFHEGFHHLPIPSIAVRGSFSRLVGAQDMNLSTAAVDASLSHVFGIGKTFNITPYAGYQALLIFANSGVLDVTPGSDEFLRPSGMSSEFVFRNSGTIVRHRPFLGARFIFSVMRIVAEYMIVPGGGSSGDLDGVAVEDNSGLQHQFTISLGLDF